MTMRQLTIGARPFNVIGGPRRLIVPRNGGLEVVRVHSDGQYSDIDTTVLNSDDTRFALAKVLLGAGGQVVEYIDNDAIVLKLALNGRVSSSAKLQYLPQHIPYGCLASALKVHRSGEVRRSHVHIGWALHGRDAFGNGAGWSCHTWLTADASVMPTGRRQIVECHELPAAYLGFDTHKESDSLMIEWAIQMKGGDTWEEPESLTRTHPRPHLLG